jgi:hypothetical protein
MAVVEAEKHGCHRDEGLIPNSDHDANQEAQPQRTARFLLLFSASNFRHILCAGEKVSAAAPTSL